MSVEILHIRPYGLDRIKKREFLLAELNRLTAWHHQQCEAYRRIVDLVHLGRLQAHDLESVPYLPVRLFKHHDLLSVPRNDIVKTMTSSGTSGQNPSRIFLDKQTSALQIKVLGAIVGSFLGKHRLPMLVIDCPSTVSDRLKFSARTAGILGFSMFGRDVTYALNDDMTLNSKAVQAFLDRHDGEEILLFGFTAIVWEYLILQLESTGTRLPLDRGVLIHGGGWKKLASIAVTNDVFKDRLRQVAGISRVHNYYGMVEQTGSIFMECEHGQLHASSFSDILIRNPLDFSIRCTGETGLIQLLSMIPHSYPGHAILSEDLGELGGIDDCPCGRKGSHFKVHGRLMHAEIRGCSDTHTR